MFKFEVPENDQSVYEITTESGNRYFIRCPGERSSKDGSLFAFLVEDGNERPVKLSRLDLVTSFTRRPDLPVGDLQSIRIGDLLWPQSAGGRLAFRSFPLE